MSSHPPFFDVRLKGFGHRAEVGDVLRLLELRTPVLGAEFIPLLESAGRVLAEAVIAAVNVPGFARAAMDGYAVRAADTRGADTDHPVRLAIVGESLPARPFAGTVEPGHAVRITTGAPMPAGADAVLVIESAREEAAGSVLALSAVIAGRNVGRVGEDVAKGSEVFTAGRRLRPQDVGLLASIGVDRVAVIRRPRVAILVTGDEILPPGSAPEGFRIVDSNSPMLAALAARDGALCQPVRYVPDRYEAVRDAIGEARADAVLVSGGSSVGKEDHAPRAVAELGELSIHGVALRPAGPLGIGFRTGSPAPVFLIPGNPVSCLCAYDLFAGRAIRRMGGRSWDLPYRSIELLLSARIDSAVGRVDYVRVKRAEGAVEPIAARGASVLSSTVEADGFVLIERNRDHLDSGETVTVWLYDQLEGNNDV
jgi:molybdopterin molybdotransferase